jgi:redox-sensitive bicupin YhaK (pirin superfamily)
MFDPLFFDIKNDMIAECETDFGNVRVIAGDYNGNHGATPPHHYANLYDVSIQKDKTAVIPCKPENNVFIFLILGKALINNQSVPEKTAVLLESVESGKGDEDCIEVTAHEEDLRFIYFESAKLGEPIAWGGPIVMNTREELIKAFDELDKGTFIKHSAK